LIQSKGPPTLYNDLNLLTQLDLYEREEEILTENESKDVEESSPLPIQDVLNKEEKILQIDRKIDEIQNSRIVSYGFLDENHGDDHQFLQTPNKNVEIQNLASPYRQRPTLSPMTKMFYQSSPIISMTPPAQIFHQTAMS